MLRPILIPATCLAVLGLSALPASAANPPKPASKPAASTTPAAAPGTPTAALLGGPEIKGVCILSQPVLLNSAKFSVAASKRLQELEAAAQAEVNSLRGPLDTDLKQLQADAAKTPNGPDIEKRRQALQVRYQQLQNTTDLRNREMQATRTKVGQRVAAEVQPVLAAVYTAHGCGLLLAREALLGGNMAEDLTAEVVRGLDAKITTMTFDREIVPITPAK